MQVRSYPVGATIASGTRITEKYFSRTIPVRQTDTRALRPFTQAGAIIEMKFASRDTATLVNVCLPDTIDPRGPKGK
jgi:hypothetical protein